MTIMIKFELNITESHQFTDLHTVLLRHVTVMLGSE